MSARIDIVNVALTMLGANPITSLDDDSDEALFMKTHYYMAKDSTLEAYEWSFAIKRFIPAQTSTPAWGWAYAFLVPADIMRVLTVERGSSGIPVASRGNTRDQVAYVVENDLILTNDSNIYCTGIRRMDDEGKFTNLFATAFACRLAMMTCLALTESKEKLKQMAIMYEGAIKEAASRDGQQGTTRRLRNQTMRYSRY